MNYVSQLASGLSRLNLGECHCARWHPEELKQSFTFSTVINVVTCSVQSSVSDALLLIFVMLLDLPDTSV